MTQDQIEQDNKKQSRGRLVLVLMFLFFAVPLVAVLLMYQFNWHPQGESRGELVIPPKKISIAEADFWKDKWSLVYLSADCQQGCYQRLHDMRQLQVSMAKDIGRVQRVLITSSSDIKPILDEYPDLQVVHEPQDIVDRWGREFSLMHENSLTAGRLYLVDPLGNLMMHYKADIPAADIRKDLVRLLRYSWAG